MPSARVPFGPLTNFNSSPRIDREYEPPTKRTKLNGRNASSPKIKSEPISIDWNKVCASISPSKIIGKVKSEIFEDDGAKIRIREGLELISSDSESEDESSDDVKENHPKTTKSKDLSPSQKPLINLGPSITFQSFKKHEKRPVQNTANFLRSRLCFHCKKYGHFRADCKNRWGYMWPNEYLNKKPWLKRKVHSIGGPARYEYRTFRRLVEDLENEALRDLVNRKFPQHHRNGKHSDNGYPSLNRFEQPFPKACRRLSPKPSSSPGPLPNPPIGSLPPFPKPLFDSGLVLPPASHFNFEQLIQNLQKQIEELQIVQMNLRTLQMQPINVPGMVRI